MAVLISGISGVRGIIGDGFDSDVVKVYTRAFAELMNRGKIIIAQDSRPSGEMFKSLVEETLLDLGCEVVDCGICPTPTAQLMVKEHQAKGGIIVTASHNPIEWNALKFVGAEGLFLDSDEHAQLQIELARVKEGQVEMAVERGKTTKMDDRIEQHIQNVLSLELVNVDAIKKRHPKVVIDAINGAGSEALPMFLERLGCDVIRLNCNNDGNFVHTPEPLPENLLSLRETVRQEGADIGIATDPDADRLAVIDENGAPLVEEYTLVLASYHALRHADESDKRPLVTNLSTTMAMDGVAKMFGREVLRTPVGEIHVARKMQQVDSLIGGEGNGGVILAESHLGRDSLVASGLILSLMAETGKSIRTIADELPRFIMVKDKLNVQGYDPKTILEALAEKYADLNPNLEDGVKITWDDRWVHFRASNTEPIIRVFAEGQSQEVAAALVTEFRTEIEALM
ncbi:MAG: phosphoglucosamine mutase [Candidatus Marinimicrobia bacterium]|nr:phosphoglucosamine mutase [Candidatus Neomarinimicrobiota bacterium]MCF7905409.1 phosphoglucosamine mutase [Candidatus Neomarinimicrobiota bacterium]